MATSTHAYQYPQQEPTALWHQGAAAPLPPRPGAPLAAPYSHGAGGRGPAVAGAAVLLGALADAAQGSHCGTEQGAEGRLRCPPRTPARPRPGPAPMQSSFLRGHVSSGMRRRSSTAAP